MYACLNKVGQKNSTNKGAPSKNAKTYAKTFAHESFAQPDNDPQGESYAQPNNVTQAEASTKPNNVQVEAIPQPENVQNETHPSTNSNEALKLYCGIEPGA